MRSHAKAESAGSNQRQATGLGRIVRGAFATRGASSDAKGSRAPKARRLVLPAVVLGLALGLAAIPANASKTHFFEEVFGSIEQPTFSNDRGMAVDQGSGDLHVIDSSDNSLYRFNSDGTPSDFAALGSHVIDGEEEGEGTPAGSLDETPQGSLRFAGNRQREQVAIDESGGSTDGNIYVTQSTGGGGDLVNIFSDQGEYLGQLTESTTGEKFGEPCGVAVDAAGTVYVGDRGDNEIHVYDPAANPPVNADNTANFATVTDPCNIAVGSGPTAGFLFVNTSTGSVLSKVDAVTGEVKYTVTDEATTVAVDPATGHVYSARGNNNELVDKYDASGATEATLISRFNPGSRPEGLAVGEGGAEIYVARSGTDNVDVYGPTVTLPEPATEEASAIGTTSATLNGTVNPDGQELTECFFEWGTSIAYGNIAPCAETVAEIGAGTTPVPVHADLTGLPVGTIHHYRLVAVNANEVPVHGEDETLQTLGPLIAATWSEDVAVTEAVLKAEINPAGKATTYRFEYGTSEAYGSETPELAVGSDSSNRVVSRFVEGLQPGTTYHYRVVATNSDAVNEGPDRTFTSYSPFAPNASCPNQEFRVGPSANLPDCRAYEMVSPIDKNGGDIETAMGGAGLASRFNSSYRRASVEGGKITFSSATAFGDAVGGHWSNQYLASRGPGGWSTHSISSRRGQSVFEPVIAFGAPLRWFTMGFFQGFTPDLSSAWVRDDNANPLTADARQGFVNLYRRDTGAGSNEALINEGPYGTIQDKENPFSPGVRPDLQRDGNEGGVRVVGASSDLSHQVFAANAPLTADARTVQGFEAPKGQLYDLVDGELHLVSVLPNGEAASGKAAFAGAASDGIFVDTREQMLKNAVSEDGSRIVWTDSGNSTSGPGAIYVRENPGEEQSASGECDEPGKACTFHVAGEPAGGGAKTAQFWAASASGSHILYSLGSHPNRTLHLFDVEARTSEKIAGGVRAVPATADDLSHVYFVSSEDLDGGGPASAGEPNLYLYREGTHAFIAAFTGADLVSLNEPYPDSTISSANAVGVKNSGAPSPIFNQTRVTPGGGHLTFMTNNAALSEAVAGYDNTDVLSGKPDFQVYRYDAAADELSCVSCKPSGARPRGHLVRAQYSGVDYEFAGSPDLRVAGSIPTHEHDNYASRVVSDDGSRIFFHSDDALLPRDTNGVQDVYQWQAPGSGACDVGDTNHFARNDGCISLISTGRDGAKSEFVDATPNGDEVYISVDEGLDPRDPGLRDIYVAKVGGGFALPSPTAPCEGEACQTPPAPPSAPTPSSAVFRGPGNPVKGPDCRASARRAKRLATRAKRLRRAARRAEAPAKARRMHRGAKRSAKRARALSKRAKRCRARNNRQADNDRRAGR